MGEDEPQPGLSAHGWLDGAEDRLRGNNGGSQPADECSGRTPMSMERFGAAMMWGVGGGGV